jgi:hypothetical protein
MPSSRPWRSFKISRSFGESSSNISLSWSAKMRRATSWSGERILSSLIKSPSTDLPSSSSSLPPGSQARQCLGRSFRFGKFYRHQHSSQALSLRQAGHGQALGSERRDTCLYLAIVSTMCTGIRIVRDWSASARVIAWRIHQVA